MVLEIATILLGASVGAVAVLYAAPRGYLGHRRTKSATQTTTIDSYAAKAEQATEVPTAAQPAPSAKPTSTPAPYESVQPAPSPVTYAAPSTASFGAPTMAKKPTRTYRRRTAPVRSGAAAKKPVHKTTKKR